GGKHQRLLGAAGDGRRPGSKAALAACGAGHAGRAAPAPGGARGAAQSEEGEAHARKWDGQPPPPAPVLVRLAAADLHSGRLALGCLAGP
ncbi:hypothetical protein MNEG_10626, partial [Monoraphidium neglectum]